MVVAQTGQASKKANGRAGDLPPRWARRCGSCDLSPPQACPLASSPRPCNPLHAPAAPLRGHSERVEGCLSLPPLGAAGGDELDPKRLQLHKVVFKLTRLPRGHSGERRGRRSGGGRQAGLRRSQ